MDDDNEESRRLREADQGGVGWRDWGPYLAERAWGTVREDYSADGDAWRSFPHDHARSRAYRWNEDGMAGVCDAEQTWCLSLALWNGSDPILKERMFGLSGPEGNHGEDVKEYWWYDDATPTHSWNSWRYHYPQAEFPYSRLIDENTSRGKDQPEFELADTGIFDDGRYWVVTVDYAKAGPHDLLMKITVENAGDATAVLRVLPTFWFRNSWSWGYPESPVPVVRASDGALVASLVDGRTVTVCGDGSPTLLFCDNETNTKRLYGLTDGTAFPKDGINDFVVNGSPTVNPELTGTKASLDYELQVPAGGKREIRVRLTQHDDAIPPIDTIDRGAGFDGCVEERRQEADEFWRSVTPAGTTDVEASILRQAMSGLLWSKQFFHFDVQKWLKGDPASPPPPAERASIRNGDWRHLSAKDVLLMPDTWEYPWFAAWDMAFHCVTLAHIDPEFAKAQIILMLREWYMHPSGPGARL